MIINKLLDSTAKFKYEASFKTTKLTNLIDGNEHSNRSNKLEPLKLLKV